MELGFGPLPEPLPQTTPAPFGDYELLEVIGRGGMGVVYKARQRSLNRLVALKMLTPHSAAFPRIAERLRLEAEAAASLHHPNIVTIHDVGENGGQPFFSMEFVEGAALDKYIDKTGYRPVGRSALDDGKGREPQSSIARMMAIIARAVDYAHKHGVLHRDLKPANIVIDATGEPHLTDFGLAKVLGRERARETDSGSILGTPAYMAPEQAAGETKRVSTAADIYSLGAILYEMLTGRPPFRGDTPLETLRQVTSEEPKHPRTFNGAVDQDLATICLKCLEKDPQGRYDTAHALAEDLKRWLRHEPIEARSIGQVERFWRWCRREPRLAGMAAGLFALLAASALLTLTLYHQEKERLAAVEHDKERQKAALLSRIEKDWNREDCIGVPIYAQELALLSGRPFNIEGNERTITLGVHPPRRGSNPLQIVQRYAPLVNWLGTNLSELAGAPLLFDLQIYTSYSNALTGFGKAEVELMLVSPASYVLLRDDEKGMQPLVRQSIDGKSELPVAIFSRAGSGVEKLLELKGKSLVFGLTGFPLFHDWVKAELSSAGLRGRDLAGITNLPRNMVISAVNAGRFDAGVSELSEVERYINAGVNLQILKKLSSPGYLWVGTRKLEPSTASAIRDSLLAIRDPDVLAAMDEELTGFEPVQPGDFDGFKRTLDQSRRFDEPD